MAQEKTYHDGYIAGWQRVTDLPMRDSPSMRQGYERGMEDGESEAVRMLRALHPTNKRALR